MRAQRTCWRKAASKRSLAVFCLVFMGMALPEAEAAFLTVSNNYLINDYTFINNPDSLPVQQAGAKGGLPTEVWRINNSGKPQLATTSYSAPTPEAGLGDSFAAPINLFIDGIADLEGFDSATATLDGIYPDFVPDNFYMYFYNNAVGDIWREAVEPTANQDYQAWYEITLDTTGGVYTATSDSANLFDPSATSQETVRGIVASNWNNIAWDVDPFAGGSIPYSAINDVSIEFFYTNVSPWLASDLPLMFSFNQASIYYTATADISDTTAPAAPPTVSATLFGATSIRVDWTNSPDSDVDFYAVKRSLTSGSGYQSIATNTPGIGETEFSYIDSSLNVDTTYYYVISATDAVGNEGGNSTEVSATTLTNSLGGSIVSINLCQYPAAPVQTIDNSSNETFGVTSLGTVVSNWNNNSASGVGNNQLFESGLHSSVSYSQTGGSDEGSYNARFDNTPMKSSPVSYGGVRSLVLDNLNANFPNGYYVIAYLAGYDSNTGTSISDGTTTIYWQVDLSYAGTLVQAESTDTSVFDAATYAVFGSTDAPLTTDSLTLTYQKLVGGGAGIGGIQVVGVAAPPAYDVWTELYGMNPESVDGAPTGDADGEGTLNVVEFALGGNPTNDLDNGYTATGTAVDGGTTWFEYVYARSTDPQSGLTYTLQTGTDLVFTNWTASGYTEMPAGDLGNGYEAVTNLVPTSADKTFVQLLIGYE